MAALDERASAGERPEAGADAARERFMSASEIDPARLVHDCFPRCKCLRCGHDRFLVISDAGPKAVSLARAAEREMANGASLIAALAVAFGRVNAKYDELFADQICERCGHTHRQFVPSMILAEKPVRILGAEDGAS